MATSSPWATLAACAPTDDGPSLADVMSEQLALDLQRKEDQRSNKDDDEMLLLGLRQSAEDGKASEEKGALVSAAADCSDDLIIAHMLQMQFDREYDQVLSSEERQQNGSSKVTVSYSKYKVAHNPYWDDDSDQDEELEAYLQMDDRKRHWDAYETAEKEAGAMPRCGYKKVGDAFVTKHDKEASQRSNGKRIMEFPPGIQTGDGGGFDMQLSNAVYNSIKQFSMKDNKRRHRIQDKVDKSTSDQAFDPQTRIILFKMVNNGVLEKVNGAISTGKEAVILHAEGGPGPDDREDPLKIPKECAIKVFKTTLSEFKTRDKYIRDDYRFRDRFSKQNPRKIIHMWAEKEMHNLMKMARSGLNVPEVVLLKKHVLLMSFIGSEGNPAPKLKDAVLSQSDLESAYEQLVAIMHTLYTDCQLVHADLSEFNVLWHNKQCWVIDVSQSVEPNHPSGLEFLMRDCSNVTDFFAKRGLDIQTAHALFTSITGLPIREAESEAEILEQLRDFERDQEVLTGLGPSDKSYPFDYCWDKSQSDREGPRQTPSRPIPGHAKAKQGKSGKSPKSMTKSPSLGKSPKSPREPKSAFLHMTDDELQSLKGAFVSEPDEEESSAVSRAKQVTFHEQEQ